MIAAYENSIARIWDLKENNYVEVVMPGSCGGAMDVNHHANLVALGCQNGATALVGTSPNPKLLHVFQSFKGAVIFVLT